MACDIYPPQPQTGSTLARLDLTHTTKSLNTTKEREHVSIYSQLSQHLFATLTAAVTEWL